MILSDEQKKEIIARIENSDIQEVTIEPVIIERDRWEVEQGYKAYEYVEDHETITLQIKRR